MPSIDKAAAGAKLHTQTTLDWVCLAGAASLGAALCAGAISGFPAAKNGIVSLPTVFASAGPASTARANRTRCEQQAWPYIDGGCLGGEANPRQQASRHVRMISTDRTTSPIAASGGRFATTSQADRAAPIGPRTVWTSEVAEIRRAPDQDDKVALAQAAVGQGQAAELPEALAQEQPRRAGTRPGFSPAIASPQAATLPSVGPTNTAGGSSMMWRRVKLAGTPDQPAGAQLSKLRRPAAMQPPAMAASAAPKHRPMVDVADGRRTTGALRPRNDRIDGPLAYAEPVRQRRMTLDSALDAYFSPLNR